MRFYLDEALSPQIAERLHLLLLAQEAIRRQQPHAGIILCSPSIRGFETGAIVDALTRLAKQFPRGLGEYDVLYLPSRV